MIEQKSAAPKYTISISVILGNPMGSRFRNTVRAHRVNHIIFMKGNRIRNPKNFTARCLVKFDIRLHQLDRFNKFKTENTLKLIVPMGC